MCAPSSVGAIDPVGITNASTTNARKMNARMNAIRIDSIVSFTPPSFDGVGFDAGSWAPAGAVSPLKAGGSMGGAVDMVGDGKRTRTYPVVPTDPPASTGGFQSGAYTR